MLSLSSQLTLYNLEIPAGDSLAMVLVAVENWIWGVLFKDYEAELTMLCLWLFHVKRMYPTLIL